MPRVGFDNDFTQRHTTFVFSTHKGWPLTAATVHVLHEKVHAADAPDAKGGKLDRFTREIEVEGNLDADQRARLAEIAERCPVHRTFHGPITVMTRLVDVPAPHRAPRSIGMDGDPYPIPSGTDA